MPAATYTIRIDQRADYDKTFTIRGRDLTGYRARLQSRPRASSGTVLLDMSTENGAITIDGPAGKIRLRLTAAQTAALAPGSHPYDFVTISPEFDGSQVRRWLKGVVQIDAGVTRP